MNPSLQTGASLTMAEQFLWDCARHWRCPERLVFPTDLDWAAVLETGKWNRMQALLLHILTAADRLAALPPASCELLQAEVARMQRNADLMSEALHEYLPRAAARGIENVVLKGLSLSLNIYGDAVMRPGGDIDLWVRRRDVAAALQVLAEMGLGQWWPNLLADPYYDRHHLHQQRCSQDLKIWFEVHWALDHPYTLLTLDYEAMLDRCVEGQLLGAPVADLTPPDLLLSVAVHLVKHAVYLPAILAHPDLQRIILADGMLMYYLDAAEIIHRHAGDMDWQQLITLAQAGGAVDILGSVLQACRRCLGAPVPAWVLSALPITGRGKLTDRVLRHVAEYELDRHLGRRRSRLWDFLLATNGAFILRPIRILDTLAYFFPDADFRRRQYGDDSVAVAVRHFFSAAGRYGRLILDTFYYTWERYRRLKRLRQSASLFNRLEVDA